MFLIGCVKEENNTVDERMIENFLFEDGFETQNNS
jgi:hypothetical protein